MMQNVYSQLCPCGSQINIEACCLPFIQHEKMAASPQALMRSRYTAYSLREYDYIINTYHPDAEFDFKASDLTKNNIETNWLALQIMKSSQTQNSGVVEFRAYYREHQQIFLLHEVSDFALYQNQWRYLSGKIADDSGAVKISRNQACFCGSGKKFKRCCL